MKQETIQLPSLTGDHHFTIKEVRRNKPELCKDVEGPDFIDLKWGKRHLFILVEGELSEPPKTDRTIKEIWETFSVYEKNLTYELVAQSLENGDYNREALVMFDDEKLEVVEALLDQAMKGDYVTIIPTSREGTWIGAYRKWVYTEEDSDNGV